MIFWVEASQQIGLGHLMESLALADGCSSRGMHSHFVITNYGPAITILNEKKIDYTAVPFGQGIEAISSLPGIANECVIVDHRSVSIEHQRALRDVTASVAVIDQLGGIEISADLLINYSLVDEWLEYDFPDGRLECLFGPDYALLRDEFKNAGTASPSNQRTRILVTMGGVDRTGATLRIVNSIALLPRSDLELDIVVGNGFLKYEELVRTIAGMESDMRDNTKISRGVSDMAFRMLNADISVCAGGNTLYELAALGTPSIVLWEDPHEEEQGKAFMNKGSAICLGNGAQTEQAVIGKALIDLIDSKSRRTTMSNCGRELVDGMGVERVADKLHTQFDGAQL